MKLSQYKINNAQVVFLGGNFDMYSVKEFEEFLNGLDIQKYTRLGLNFKELNSIDSSGIGALLRFGREMEKKNAEIAFYDVPGNILTIFINSGLNQIFQIMSTLQFENSFIKETKINSLVYKMKKKYRSFFQTIGSYRNLLAFIILALFCMTVFLTEKITYDLEKSKGAELSSFIQSYLWDMDDKNAKDFAEILIETKGYRKIQINHSDGSVFIDAVSKEKPSGFRFLLEQLRIIRSVSIFSDIYHKETVIGRLEI
ncbi:MAG TPA: STAS domain-containing protein, partial [Leptospiraceae bacterium]|nr:STAS domain-containing protein [Leptospiraceae bacterium]